MPTLIMIDGAVTEQVSVTYAAQQAVNVGTTQGKYIARRGFEVRGRPERLALTAFQAGIRQNTTAYEAIIVGHTATVENLNETQAARMALTVNGLTTRPAIIALQVAATRAALASPARMTVTVGDSRNVAAPGLSSLQVKSYVHNLLRQGLVVRQRNTYFGPLSLEVHTSFVRQVLSSVVIGGPVSGTARHSVQVRSADTFFVLADIIEADLVSQETGTGFFPAQFINGRLLVNGAEVPIKNFSYSEADGKVGATLNVTLAQPLIGLVPLGASVEFKCLVRNAAGVWKGRTLVSGKIGSRGLNIAYRGGENGGPADQVVISSVDVLNERFSLAPRRNVIMFDPKKVALTDVAMRLADATTDLLGNPYLPVIEPVEGLTLQQALNRAYTKYGGGTYMTALTPEMRASMSRISSLIGSDFTQAGLGFDAVVTNIPNYPLTRADFTESGWHDGIQPHIGLFGPMFFVFGNLLHVINIERPLPAGYTLYQVPLKKYKSLALDTPYKDPRNAVLLTYMDDLSDLTGLEVREEFEQDTDKQGLYGTVGYTEVYTEDKWRRYYRFGELIAEFNLTHKVETRTAYQAGDGSAGPLILVHSEFQQDFYTGSLKTGHDKMVSGLILVGADASMETREIEREKCVIFWEDDPSNPGQVLQSNSFMMVEGLVYISSETRETATPSGTQDVQLRWPALVAQAGNAVTDDGTFSWQAIRTVSERLRAGKGNQIDVETVTIDHLNNTYSRSTSQPRTGSRVENLIKGRQRHVLLRDLDSEAEIGPRIPITLNAGELPRALALELGQRTLYRGTHPLTTERLALPGVDFAIGKGSIIQAQVRDGSYSGKYVVVGFTITGNDLGQPGQHRISMSLEGVELPT